MVLRILIALLLLPLTATTQVLQLDAHGETVRVNEKAQWLEDGASRYVGPELLSPRGSDPFRKARVIEEFFNRKQKAVFYRFQFQEKKRDHLFLIIDNANVDEVDLWYTDSGRVRHVAAGNRSIREDEVIRNNKIILRMATDGGIQTVLVKARSARKLIVPTYLSGTEGLHKFLWVQNGLDVLMLGMVLMLLLYNLFMVAQTKSRSQLLYILYLLSLIVYAFFYMRGFRYVLPQPALLFIQQFSVTWGSFCYLFALLFAQAYLRKKAIPARFRTFFQYLVVLPLSNILFDLAGLNEPAYLLSVVLAFLTPASMLAIGMLAYQTEDKSILFFLLGWTSVSLCTIANTLLLLELIPPSIPFIPQILLAGTCLEMLFLSSALGYRFSKAQKEKLALQQQVVLLLNNQNAELEMQVADRTKALADALLRMEESNALKARLLAIISHDLKMPFVSLNAALDLLSLNILTPEKAQQKLAIVRSNIRHIAGTLENLLTWSKHQQQTITTHPEPLCFPELAKNVCSLMDTSLTSKNLQLHFAIEPDAIVLADRFQLEAIMRNLVSNALKATPANSEMGIRCVPEAGRAMYRITVFDSGNGIQEKDLAAWLGSSRPLQEGNTLLSGLGLQICREFLANHHSELCYNHNTSGSEFSFLLPAAGEGYRTETQQAANGLESSFVSGESGS